MIGWLISTKVGRAIGAAMAFLFAVLTFGAIQRKRGVEVENSKRLRRDAEKRKQADDEANDLRGADRGNLNKRLRENDNHW